jgi:hypothetical protein
MAKLQLKSEERMELVASLEALLGCVKSLHASVGDVMAEVVAMRTAVLENPGDIAWYQTNLKLVAATAKPVLGSYNDMIAEFAGSQRYKN